MMRRVIANLQKAGYTVVAYDTSNDIFLAGDPAILAMVIGDIREDIKQHVAAFKQQRVTEFAFFGSSLGTFVLYNCINDITELSYGVFNTGGNIAHGMWKLFRPHRRHLKKGITLPRLEQEWYDLQHPTFENLKNHSYMFVSSHGDTIVPLKDIDPYIVPVRKAGAHVVITELKSKGHVPTVIAALRIAPKLLEQVKSNL